MSVVSPVSQLFNRFISRTVASMAAASTLRPRLSNSSSTYWYLVLPLLAP